ncbi:general transcription factor 3C polypeptide 5-like [Daphnia carinata]|uniref:general transcription factor 3C polypeptide 5-like n=1 Tax=Daphnia carinata TaxID=120202 RepID=UPI00257FA413|nr:general transcription factor 3C polypeptide 5-like [Daphnia carinata]
MLERTREQNPRQQSPELDVSKLKRTIVSVEYPGRVVNDNEAFRTMGGLGMMSAVHSKENRKIELRFRPDDPFCKPTHGEQVQTSNLLFKIIKTTKKNRITKKEEVTYQTKLEGVIRKTYRFLGLCDFQYLPMVANTDTTRKELTDKFVSILELVVPQKLETLEWLEESAPVFMSPPVFSRMDLPVDYHFRKDTTNALGMQYDGNVIGRLRKKRAMQTIFLDYSGGPAPTKPRDMALCNLTVRFIMPDDLALIKKMFEERPVWTKAALTYHVAGVDKNSLRFILASAAYYFTTGPWRNAWVRIGYDPRQDPEARTYQILDFRISQNYRNKVVPKRSYSKYNQPHKYVSTMRTKTSSIRQTADIPSTSTNAVEKKGENSYVYRPGMIPQCRQMFYQYLDLHVPEIEELLSTSTVAESCDERYGWYPPHFEDECRRILNNYISDSFAHLKPEKNRKKKSKIQEQTLDEGEDDEYSEEEDLQLDDNNLEESGDDEDSSGDDGGTDDGDEEYKPSGKKL